jgi:hypothetical protein
VPTPPRSVAPAGSGRAQEGAQAAQQAGALGLVHYGNKDAATWAAYDLQRRLSRLRRRTLTRARVQSQEVDPQHQAELLTLTYAPGHEWSPRHVRRCMNAYRLQASRDGIDFRYEWVAELQLGRMRRRGETSAQCLHYHALLWTPIGYSYPHADTRGWWPHGMSQVERARNPVSYLAKYASKGTAGEQLPRGCRVSGGGGISALGRSEVRWWMLPRYVREAFPAVGAAISRKRGGGWIDWDSGEWIPAQWPDTLPSRPPCQADVAECVAALPCPQEDATA